MDIKSQIKINSVNYVPKRFYGMKGAIAFTVTFIIQSNGWTFNKDVVMKVPLSFTKELIQATVKKERKKAIKEYLHQARSITRFRNILTSNADKVISKIELKNETFGGNK